MAVTQLRPVTLGGSTAAAACGISPYQSRVALWAELTGRVTREPTDAMRFGTLLEPVVCAELRTRGYDVFRAVEDANAAELYPLRDDARPWLTGNPDGFTTLDGQPAVLEVKTASAFTRMHGDAVPVHYAAQVQTYLHLTGLQRALFACLVGGQRLEIAEIERDQDAIDLMLVLMAEFMGYVERDEPPAPDGSESARDALLALHGQQVPGMAIRATREVEQTVKELHARKEQAAAVKDQVRELENQLRAFCGDAETVISRSDVTLYTWKQVASTRLDQTRLKKEAPHVYQQYAVTTTTRRMTVT